jgi:hypothetical protein
MIFHVTEEIPKKIEQPPVAVLEPKVKIEEKKVIEPPPAVKQQELPPKVEVPRIQVPKVEAPPPVAVQERAVMETPIKPADQVGNILYSQKI